MTNDFDSALRHLLKTIVQEVAVDLLKEQHVPDRPHPQQATHSDDAYLLKPREAAKRLAISERHLHRLTHSGIVPCVRVGQSVRYSIESIQKWIRESESTGPPQTNSAPLINGQAAPVPNSKAPPKKAAPMSGTRPRQEPDTSSRSSSKKTESEEHRNPFSDLLNEFGLNRSCLPTITNGELRRIAEVDGPTLHGWMHLNRELPEAALNKLREHFVHI